MFYFLVFFLFCNSFVYALESLPNPFHKKFPFYVQKHIIYGGYNGGRLGNQFFQIAATLNLAIKNNAEALFPDYLKWQEYGIPENLEKVFFRIKTTGPFDLVSEVYEEDPNFNYAPIPFIPNMKVKGYFQSEKYFKENKDQVLAYFKASDAIREDLTSRYKALLNHPNTVAIHLRAYQIEDPNTIKCFTPVGLDYVKRAAALFNKKPLFVIFSDNIEWAKNELKDFTLPHIFIENEPAYNDLYLMSFLKHQIISNSSFSWWAAYLNDNPNKIVVAPLPWFQPTWHNGPGNESIIPEGWITLVP